MSAADASIAMPASSAGEARTAEGPADAFAVCREIVRTRARNFFYGLRLCPEPRRSAVYAVYAWMRRADDEADEAADPAKKAQRIELLAGRTERLLSGRPLGDGLDADPVWRAFGWTITRYGLDHADVRGMIEGLREDIGHETASDRASPRPFYRTAAELDRYCYRVASTVGHICVRIWGVREGADARAARDLATRRGLAFQLTNILRDVGRDFDEGRVYIPGEMLDQAGLTAEDLRRWTPAAACHAVIGGLGQVAEGHYAASSPLEGMVSADCRATLWAMTAIYRGLLAKIRARPGRVVESKRIRLSSLAKASIAARASVAQRLGLWSLGRGS
ncbi:MAG: phytoene/squalene synthase family protein [Phycisphaerales bacterium]|nr:phytoene/squalene synthase family protein [Phycisphaerales bacterium]